jgi:putative tributyrin esterase
VRRVAFTLLAALALGASATPSRAQGETRTDSLWSQALGASKKFLVHLPPSYASQPQRRFPVVYYLHGLWGSEGDWTKQGHLTETMDSLVASGMREMIIVMPDGDDGWYTTWNRLVTLAQCRQAPPSTKESLDTYCVPWPHYDDYIARDLTKAVDAKYRTRADRAHRGIAGLSMGGYGAVSLATQYPDVFSAAASHSGFLSPLYAGPRPYAPPATYFTTPEQIRARWAPYWFSLGPAFGSDTLGWRARDPATMVRQLTARRRALVPRYFIDVGVGDPFIDQNRDFHHALQSLGIEHTYTEWPGEHNWPYWRAHAVESLKWLADRIAR